MKHDNKERCQKTLLVPSSRSHAFQNFQYSVVVYTFVVAPIVGGGGFVLGFCYVVLFLVSVIVLQSRELFAATFF